MVNLSSLNPFTPSIKASSEIIELRIYPIKSCRGISIKTSVVTRQGLDLDRRWMFVDVNQKNEFQTIRQNPRFTLIDTSLTISSVPGANGLEDEVDLVASIRGRPDKRIQIPARPSKKWLEDNTTPCEVEIWSNKTDAHMYRDEVNKVFSEFLGKPVALVYKGPTPRMLGLNGSPKYLGREESINFPDIMPILVANYASVMELNSRLKEKGQEEITIERFRPNIILRGGSEDCMAPWSEDIWKTLRLISAAEKKTSTIDFDVIMRCARCQVPNVDPDTAEKHKNEPWDTLVSYRRIDEGIKFKPCFGMLCASRTVGPIEVGMKIQVLETTQNHKFVRN